MNLDLLQQFSQNYPEEFDGVLGMAYSFGSTAAFNRRGSVLAVGCNDGRVYIWDFLTRGIAKTIPAHVSTITSLSWSRNGKLLATSSIDGSAGIWDVLTSDCLLKMDLKTSVFSIQFSPRDHSVVLIRPLKQPSILVKFVFDSSGKSKFYFVL